MKSFLFLVCMTVPLLGNAGDSGWAERGNGNELLPQPCSHQGRHNYNVTPRPGDNPGLALEPGQGPLVCTEGGEIVEVPADVLN